MENYIQKNTITDIIKPELLVPAGDFDCVRAGAQNGADCVYFGANMFSARASAKNFSLDELKQVIEYCKIRNVKTNLTLNTLLTDTEFDNAIELSKNAYNFGIDAIIVQDLGLGKYLIDNFPGIEIHGSTQMSVHNLEGVLELEKLGFSRVVLSRELPINEIEYIRNNCKIDLEMFIHGALCISYSGQCLFSSLVGGRSGNRGKCAQPCRLPYELLEDDKCIDKGYLLSPKDLCSLDYLPALINMGINSFKIEGRMKTPEYVATVTRIYRKYIDMAISLNNNVKKYDLSVSTESKLQSNSGYVIDDADKRDLLQVFNRGGFSTGHLSSEANGELIYSEKPNNMGLYLGNISNYNSNKGHITLKLNEPLAIGDSISIDGETGKYTVSEIIKNNSSLRSAQKKEIVKLGRMKGNIHIGAKVYRVSSKELIDNCKYTFSQEAEIKKIPISFELTIKKNLPIQIKVRSNVPPFYNDISIEFLSDIIPEESITVSTDVNRIKEQFSKLGNTPYVLDKININMDENLHIPSISALNQIRRTAVTMLEDKVMNNFLEKRTLNLHLSHISSSASNLNNLCNRKITVLLSNMDISYDYTKLTAVDNIYIPLKYWTNKKYVKSILDLSTRFDTYVYMPTIIKANYKNLLLNSLNTILGEFDIKGFVISNISGFMLLKDYFESTNIYNELVGNNSISEVIHNDSVDNNLMSEIIHNKKISNSLIEDSRYSKYKFVSNYTMNVFNTYSINELKKLGIDIVTPSVELNKNSLQELCNKSSLPIELIAYGRTVLMNSSYCLLGKSNKCYPECKMRCSNNSKYYLKDRLGFKFRIMPDNIQTVTSIYNSKITSISTTDIPAYSLRIDILDENIDEINKIIQVVKTGNKLEGKDYTNGNLNKEI